MKKFCGLFMNSMQNAYSKKIYEIAKSQFLKSFLRIPLSEKILFAKHLSMMVNAGMTEVDSVRLIRKQVKSKSFNYILDRILADLESGQFLSVSLRQFSSAFGEMFISLIAIGEISGTLSENLNYLAFELKKSQQLRSKVRSALIYPAVIFAATMGVSAILVFFVLPKILPVFYSLRIELPAETKFLIAGSNFLFHYYYWVIAGVFVFFILVMFLLKIPAVRYFYHRFILLLPFVGKTAVAFNMASITRTLGILLKSGIKIVEAVSTTSNMVSSDVYKRALLLTAEEIRKGEPLYKYFEKHPSLFPPTVSRMIEVGENTGKLEENLFYLADFYENEVDEITKNLSSILEPVMLVVMGTLVGFVVISIIKPIYQVSQSLYAK